ncbi:flagellar hook protein FlgE [Candidatus Nitrotoga sp. HW29]|uniref:flagellar hook protein FlgE n=1 Tax=Candidatus Nitrotoga sp. HW29 TaxID=2886963 RepID=UPI001EF1F81B|nr:flagellar hook protein FlgE [Candidatus Nitrotoga sp. HW29]CAH1904218.1 flagellar hook protein FlgE [Candidatus Nitrotoga sp. HW29]
MGFQQGLSGLNAAAQNLNVIGNNVANASTVGFKQSQAQFADVYASTLGGSGGLAAGIGTKISTVAQQFGQGNISVTDNPLDIAISGQGFYQLDNNGAIAYSRNGQFQLDKNGFIVNAQGHKLTGFAANPLTGAISLGSAVPLQISTQSLTPLPSSTSSVGVNLDSRMLVPTTSVFSPIDSTSYNSSTALTLYDSLGNSHIATTYFVKNATVNTWDVHMTVDGLGLDGTPATATNTLLGTSPTLTFNTTGALITPATGIVSVPGIVYATGSTTPQPLTFNFLSSTQFGAAFAVNQLTQNGYTSGQLSGFNTSADGTIVGRYTNGQSKALGQVLLANFANPQGLQPVGNNEWSASASSGPALIGTPGTSSLGVVQSSAVEDSNVDLTAELVNMIMAQRVYQANAQTIKTEDAMMQTITNLR